jgi:hypothetical protein
MKERPIIFHRKLIPGLLDGRVGLTCRVMNPQPVEVLQQGAHPTKPVYAAQARIASYGEPVDWIACPYGRAGDRLYVKEAFKLECPYEHECGNPDHVYYRAGINPELAESMKPWKSPLFMPKWATRILLLVLDTKAMPLHDLREADAQAAGWDMSNLPPGHAYDGTRHALEWYQGLWKEINDKRGYAWESTWVWRVRFRVEWRQK